LLIRFFDVILKFLFDNGLSNELLKKYKIHPSELSSMIHLKLLQNNLIQDEFEYQSVMQQNDLKENARKEHLGRAIDKINHLVEQKIPYEINKTKILIFVPY